MNLEDALELSMLPPQALVDMRHVSLGREAGTFGQKTQKAIFEKDPIKFTDRLLQAEKEWREVVGKLKSERVVAADEGTERCEELIERLLKEFEAG